MRGYELISRSLSSISATSYESPCGVMSALQQMNLKLGDTLRIPMRGYEFPVAVDP